MAFFWYYLGFLPITIMTWSVLGVLGHSIVATLYELDEFLWLDEILL